MSLTFTGTANLVFTADPNTLGGGSTVMLVFKNNQAIDGTSHLAIAFQNTANATRLGLRYSNGLGEQLGYTTSVGTLYAPTITIPSTESYVAVAVSKVSGVTAPRFHKYVYATGVASHENAGATAADGVAIGAGGTMRLSGNNNGAASGTSHTPGIYVAAAMFDRVLSDSEFESAAQSLSALKALAPNWGLWVFDHAITGQSDEFFIGSTYSTLPVSNGVSSATSITSEGPPFGYGYPIEMDAILGPSGGTGTVTFTGGGVLSIIGSGSIAPPDPSPPQPVGTGWTMVSVTPAGVTTDVKFTDTGNFTHDQNRPIRRAISGFTLLPTEAAKLDLARDSIHAYLRVDDQSYPMGIFYFTESSRQKDAIIGPDGQPADLIHVSLSDQFIRLQRSDEVPRIALAGADPSQEMIKYIGEADVPHSITGAENPIADDVLWQPFTPYETIVTQLAELAGHRRPWADNYGVIRSVAARVVDSDVIPLEELEPIAGTIVITENYLSAPNRVVVYDDSAMYPIVGVWDAPASAPNNATNRGWVTTTGVQAQGLSGENHARQVAETLGEQFSSRKLFCDIVPTNRLDGPVVLSYDGALWLVDSWAVSTKVGSTMSFDATELILSPSEEQS